MVRMADYWKIDKWWKKLFYGIGWVAIIFSGPFIWLIAGVSYHERDKKAKEKSESIVHGYQKFAYVFGVIYTLIVLCVALFYILIAIF